PQHMKVPGILAAGIRAAAARATIKMRQELTTAAPAATAATRAVPEARPVRAVLAIRNSRAIGSPCGNENRLPVGDGSRISARHGRRRKREAAGCGSLSLS